MKVKSSVSDAGAAIWQRTIQFNGKPSATAARALLKIRFSEGDHALMEKLSDKARTGTLSSAEQLELDIFERLGCLLDIIHSKARRVLKKKPKRAS